MPRIDLPLTLDSYQSESSLLAAQRCINWIPVTSESTALTGNALMQPPGLTQIAKPNQENNRGAALVNSTPYFVCGEILISLTAGDAVNNIGEILGSERISLATNGRYLVIVADTKSYVYDTELAALSEITATNFRQASSVVFKDGYFVFSAKAGDVFFNSALNDPYTYDALDFGTAEINPDKIVGLHVNHNELFVCGEDTIELFQNIGGSGFPFQRIQGANIQKGVLARHTLLEFDNTFCFVGGGFNEQAGVWRVSGSSSAVKISTNAIDYQLQLFTVDELQEAFSLTLQRRGQSLFIITIDSDRIPGKTFAYNATASALSGRQIWFELQSGNTDNRWSVQTLMVVNNRTLVGDTLDRIGQIDDLALTYYGAPIHRSISSSPFSLNGLPVFEGEFEVTVGTGLAPDNGTYVIALDFSDDGSRTFKPQTYRSIGKIGNYTNRVIWRRQGRFPVSRVIRLTITDDVECNVLKYSANIERGYQ